MVKVYIGVDPGAGGGIAALFVSEKDGRTWEEVICVAMPQTRAEVMFWLKEVTEGLNTSEKFACVELVTGYIKSSADGEVGGSQPGSAAFKFGMQYERCLFALEVCEIRFDTVPPVKWQQGVGVSKRGKGEKKAAHKRKLKERACQLFPLYKGVTLKVCDALLLAEYCRRKKESKL